MIGCLRTRVSKQPIIVLYFESVTVLKFYNLEAWTFCCNLPILGNKCAKYIHLGKNEYEVIIYRQDLRISGLDLDSYL